MNQLLPLYDNYIFKKVFTKDKEILLDLLNSFPQFQGRKKIKKIKILNPEILGSKKKVKDTVLDIHAEDFSGNVFLVEMQTDSHAGFSKRILFNWSKLYSTGLTEGFFNKGLLYNSNDSTACGIARLKESELAMGGKPTVRCKPHPLSAGNAETIFLLEMKANSREGFLLDRRFGDYHNRITETQIGV